MESLPRRQPSQRRSSPEQTSPNRASTHTSTSPARTRSQDTQPLFSNSIQQEQDAEQQQQEEHAQPPAVDIDADPTVKKCWICFADSTEDEADTSPWRDPCPCALVAHEECLLDWIADLEAPNNRGAQRGMASPKIECPQCKSEIRLARPRDYVVDGVRVLTRLGAKVTTPGALAVLGSMFYNSSMLFGIHSTYAVFGAEDGFRILYPLISSTTRLPLEFDNATARELGDHILAVTADHLAHWRLFIGLPLIFPVLTLSRTTLADSILPVLPILFFATQTPTPQDSIEFGQWPPSASLAFALLPYLRAAYNTYYERVWADKERRWLKEIQPRVREGEAEGLANADPDLENAGGEDGNIFEVRIDGGIWEDWEEDSDDEDDAQRRVAGGANEAPPVEVRGDEGLPRAPEPAVQANPPLNVPQDGEPGLEAANVDGAGPAAQAEHHHHVAGAERRLSFSPTAVAETVLGAIAFPTIAGISGELLRLALPRSWTTAALGGPRGRMVSKGLLQQKWGRSLIGGCLFVVLKDCVTLYVKWKMAQLHRQRRVVDYQGKTTREADPPAASA